jgi:hypothetical protein
LYHILFYYYFRYYLKYNNINLSKNCRLGWTLVRPIEPWTSRHASSIAGPVLTTLIEHVRKIKITVSQNFMFKCVNFRELVLFGSLVAHFQTMRDYLIAMLEESSILRALFLDDVNTFSMIMIITFKKKNQL